MNSSEIGTLSIPLNTLDESALSKGIYICILHAKRIPPHIGIIINGFYHSLTIKGAEPNVELKPLLKTIQQKKIASYFLKIVPHPVYSISYLNDVFLEILKEYPNITSNSSTCLTPLKLFFNEYYALNSSANDIIYSFLSRLNNNNFILEAYSLNLTSENNMVEIPVYSQDELNSKIKDIRSEYYND